MHGFHEYTVRAAADGGTVLTHLLAMHVRRSARVTWPVGYRWMHDALLEDSLDVAERAITGTVRSPARYSWYVRVLRACRDESWTGCSALISIPAAHRAQDLTLCRRGDQPQW